MSDWLGDGLRTSARIMLGEGGAASRLNGDRVAVQASFAGLALMMLIDAGISAQLIDAAAALPQDGEKVARASKPFAVFALAAKGLAAYAAAVATIMVLVGTVPQRERFPAYLIAQNWGEAVLSAALFVPSWLLASMPPVAVDGAEVQGWPIVNFIIFIGIMTTSFVARYRICMHALDVTGVRAFWMVAASFVAAFTMLGILPG